MIKNIIKLLKGTRKPPKFPEESSERGIALKKEEFSGNLKDTLKIIKEIYNIPSNLDVKIRELNIQGINKPAALIFISTIVDVMEIEARIIEPLLRNQESDKRIDDIVTSQTVECNSKMEEIITRINKGFTILLIEGETVAYFFNTTKLESRAIESTQNEITLRGPKEAFTEKAITNISLIRKKIRNENLNVYMTEVSKRSKNDVFILYIKDIANEKIVHNVKKRLSSLDLDAVQNLALLEQYVEERNASLFPTVLYTERPDRAASFLEDGHIILIMDNSPDSLILPATFWSFFHNPEEHYLRFPYANFTRLLRITALFISVFTTAIYISVTNYHSEMIPPDLLLAISASREKVPFPAIVEILIMEAAFELIREAGLRVPSPIGPTIGIVGALILGQAAVEANIISPLIIIVVALGGLSSFAISDINLNYTLRLIKFLFILSAGCFGIYGMTCLFTVGLFYMVSLKSFGVPYLSPFTPRYASSGDTIFRRVLKNEKIRPGYVKPKDIIKKGS